MIKTIEKLRRHGNPDERLTGNNCAVAEAWNQEKRKQDLSDKLNHTGNDRYDLGTHTLKRVSQDLNFQQRYKKERAKAQVVRSVLQNSLIGRPCNQSDQSSCEELHGNNHNYRRYKIEYMALSYCLENPLSVVRTSVLRYEIGNRR